MKALVAILLAAVILSSGCVGGKTDEQTSQSAVTQNAAQPDVPEDYSAVDLIGDNDTVEIGEMI